MANWIRSFLVRVVSVVVLCALVALIIFLLNTLHFISFPNSRQTTTSVANPKISPSPLTPDTFKYDDKKAKLLLDAYIVQFINSNYLPQEIPFDQVVVEKKGVKVLANEFRSGWIIPTTTPLQFWVIFDYQKGTNKPSRVMATLPINYISFGEKQEAISIQQTRLNLYFNLNNKFLSGNIPCTHLGGAIYYCISAYVENGERNELGVFNLNNNQVTPFLFVCKRFDSDTKPCYDFEYQINAVKSGNIQK